MYGFDEYEYFVDEYQIEDVRADLKRIVEYFKSKDYHNHAMKLFIEDYRKLPLSIAEEADAFCVDEELNVNDFPEWMKSEPLGFVKGKHCPMSGRCVFPIKDVLDNVMGFVGWDPFVEPKYLDSKNYGYKAKNASLYGMEKLQEYYNSNKPVIITEGLMCTLYLRSKEFCALASLGSHLTPYVIQILKRFSNRLIVIPDLDDAGEKYVKQIKRDLPNAKIYQVKYGKDIDGCRKFNDGIYENDLLEDLSKLSLPLFKSKILIRR